MKHSWEKHQTDRWRDSWTDEQTENCDFIGEGRRTGVQLMWMDVQIDSVKAKSQAGNIWAKGKMIKGQSWKKISLGS